MNAAATTTPAFTPLPARQRVLFAAIAVASFHIAYAVPVLAFVIVGWVYGLFRLSEAATARQAFWTGVAVALAAYVPHVWFFFTIFKFSALALWMVLAFWIGLFLVTLRFVRVRLGAKAACWLAPFLWTGFEFFRGELYPLRFTWLTPGYAFSEMPMIVWAFGGMYGVAFWLMVFAVVAIHNFRRKTTWQGLANTASAIILAILIVLGLILPRMSGRLPITHSVNVAAVQIEHEHDLVVLDALEKARQKHPKAELFVTSELTFDGPVPERVQAWCRANHVFLITGGKDIVARDVFYNTVFVVAPTGEIVFKQAKTQPVQFMADGLPAPQQRVWDSPWGKIGLCICYDLSFTRVTDELIRQGAQALIVPTADEIEWGEYQHRLHARVAPVRAAEYGVPILRVASSGISQLVNASGTVLATAPFPGQGESFSGSLTLNSPRQKMRTLPSDRYLVWPCVIIAWGVFAWTLFEGLRQRFSRKSQIANLK